MIRIVAKNKIKNGMVDNFKETAKELIIRSNKENGCISYDLYVDMNDSSILTFLESWEDEEAIFNHNNSEHFKEIVPQLGEFIEEKEVRKYILVK
ncbi:putative quinol monooxygenase [Clostridiaceae bacterium HSG29]|nr:putative quinol monooxygenase [Clostridiaceae bacterium HSG29]